VPANSDIKKHIGKLHENTNPDVNPTTKRPKRNLRKFMTNEVLSEPGKSVKNMTSTGKDWQHAEEF